MSERTELPMRPDRCETCRFWELTPWGKGAIFGTDEAMELCLPAHPNADHEGCVPVGECRRLPPQMVGVTHGKRDYPDDALGEWPITTQVDWCGEWRSRACSPTPPQAAG